MVCTSACPRRAPADGLAWRLCSHCGPGVAQAASQHGHGIKGPSDLCRLLACACHASWASCSMSGVFMALYRAKVSVCNFSSHLANSKRMRSMSESLPRRKSSHGGRFLKAVMAKLSERVKATKGNPCLEAGRKRLLPTMSSAAWPGAVGHLPQDCKAQQSRAATDRSWSTAPTKSGSDEASIAFKKLEQQSQ